MSRWREFRLWYRAGPVSSELFSFKKERLVLLLDRLRVGYSFILDEPDFVLVRIQVDADGESTLMKELEQAIRDPSPFSKVTIEDWSPDQDARTRIADALSRLQSASPLPPEFKGPGWQIVGRGANGAWVIQDQNLEEKVEEFAKFISEVAGKFTVAYLRAMPSRVEDRWLKSLFVHVLLDSISTNLVEEKEVRDFPAI